MFFFHHETFEVFEADKPTRHGADRGGPPRLRCTSLADGKVETHARTVLRGPFKDAAHANEGAGYIRRLTENHNAAVAAARDITARCEADRDAAIAEALKARGIR